MIIDYTLPRRKLRQISIQWQMLSWWIGDFCMPAACVREFIKYNADFDCSEVVKFLENYCHLALFCSHLFIVYFRSWSYLNVTPKVNSNSLEQQTVDSGPVVTILGIIFLLLNQGILPTDIKLWDAWNKPIRRPHY